MTDSKKVNLFGAMARILTVLFTVTGMMANQITQETRTVLNYVAVDGMTNSALRFVSISVRDLQVSYFFCGSDCIRYHQFSFQPKPTEKKIDLERARALRVSKSDLFV